MQKATKCLGSSRLATYSKMTATQTPQSVVCFDHVSRAQQEPVRSCCVRSKGPATLHMPPALQPKQAKHTCRKGPLDVAPDCWLGTAAHERQQIEGGIEMCDTSVRHACTDSSGLELAKTRELTLERFGPCDKCFVTCT